MRTKHSNTAVALAFLISLLGPTLTLALPPGFVDEFVAETNNPIDLVFLPVPTQPSNTTITNTNQQAPMMVTDKSGFVTVLLDHENSDATIQVADFSSFICTDGARGVMGIAPHPNFGQDGSIDGNLWVYVFYTWKEPVTGDCYNRISRFLVVDPASNDYTFRMETQQVLVQLGRMADDLHLGSDMAFGKDGNLWVTNGDNGYTREERLTQKDNYLFGKLLRITPEGDAPLDNPHVNAPNAVRCHTGGIGPEGTVCVEAYATGLRSPFKMALDPNTEGNKVRVRISDVGGSSYEELSDGGTDFPGANYGWPDIEGPCNRVNGVNLNRRNCTRAASAGFDDPAHWYAHESTGGAVTGGAFVPNGIWPAEYDDSFLFSEYTQGIIYQLVYDESVACRECQFPRSAYRNTTFVESEKIITMRFGPYKGGQALYIMARLGRYANIRRIRYTGGSNISPTAKLQVLRGGALSDGVDILPGDIVSFDATASSDPDSSTLFYTFDFGDGSRSGTVPDHPIVEHIYSEAGVYEVLVTVTDSEGGSSQALSKVQVGRLPSVTMLSPPAGSTFAVGDVFDMIGAAVNSNDGTAMPDASLTWEIRRHHNTHFHPWLAPTPGNNLVTRSAPPPEDFLATGNSYMEILLTATDDLGLTSTTTIDIHPRTVLVDFTVVPSELEVDFRVFGYVVTAPQQVLMWENHELVIEAPDVPGYQFSGWSDGGGQLHTITIPTMSSSNSSLAYVATYQRLTVDFEADPLFEDYAFINCGSTRDYNDGKRVWVADSKFDVEGGSRSNTRIPVAGTDDPKLFQLRRRGDLVDNGPNVVYRIPVTKTGVYKVALFFVEFSRRRSNQRVFTIQMEGQNVLPSYDILDAGGRQTVVQEEVLVSVDDGILNIEFIPEMDRPEISAIAIYAPVTPDQPLVFLNCGSTRDYDDGNHVWVADRPFVTVGGRRRNTAKNVTNTVDPDLFQRRREGDMVAEGPSIVYNIPVPSLGLYKVELYFVEFIHKFSGRRIFSVTVEGETALPSYDIYDTAGLERVVMEEVLTVVQDGMLTIEIVAEVERPEIAAIAVYGA